MDIIRIIGISFIALFINMIFREYKKEYTLYVAMITGIIIFGLSLSYLTTIIETINKLSVRLENKEFISSLFKITGIALLTEYAVTLCKDSGENAIASKIDFAGKIIIISLSIPIISNTFDTLLKILPS